MKKWQQQRVIFSGDAGWKISRVLTTAVKISNSSSAPCRQAGAFLFLLTEVNHV